jgi:hypothetical protein
MNLLGKMMPGPANLNTDLFLFSFSTMCTLFLEIIECTSPSSQILITTSS